MSYESNPAGIGVGKRYGERGLGGVEGSVKTFGKEVQLTFHLTGATSDETYKATILQDYRITGLLLDVDEAFAASSTAQLSVNGGAGLTTALNLTSAVVSAPALTGLANTTGQGPVDIVLTPNANAIASAVGKAKLVVTYERI